MSRKDYVDNWESEMHETFCFWDFNEWKEKLQEAGFLILPDSKPYTNPWIVKNRIVDKVKLFEDSDKLIAIDYPVTSMILLAVKN